MLQVNQVAIIIPARMNSTRLPGKILADIGGKPMVVRVMEQAYAAKVGDVYVACAEEIIAEQVIKYGGNPILTDPQLKSGTDRINQALKSLNNKLDYDFIINLQGDLPNISPTIIQQLVKNFTNATDIITPIAKIKDESDISNPNVVKVAFSPASKLALYFSRSAIPYNAAQYYQHIGIYGYKKESLERFVALQESFLEEVEKLEQLRALEHGIKIQLLEIDDIPLSVDTINDLNKIIKIYKK